jgi:predicted enzyme related to lactoylglutathione lyase
MNRIIHFEIHAKDMDKLQKFYQDVFGWDFKDFGKEMGYFRGIMTGKDSPGSMWKGIDGGMTPRQGEMLPGEGDPINAFVCTIEVENIDDMMHRIQKAGGTEATAKMEVPGVGWLAYHKDLEGNIFGILQPMPKG